MSGGIDPDRYKSQGIYRPEDLYYDLGYKFAKDSKSQKADKAIDYDFMYYLLGISFLMQFILNIMQIFSIISIVLVIIYKSLNPKQSVNLLSFLLILLSHIGDYHYSNILVLPGRFVQGNLTVTFWFFEIVWVVIFGMQAMITFQPVTPALDKNATVLPATPESQQVHKDLRNRLERTEFELKPIDQIIDIERLKEILMDLFLTIGAIAIAALILDFVLWEILSSFGGGNNIVEEYFISGMALFLFALIIGFSRIIYPEKEESKIPEKEGLLPEIVD